MIHDTRIKDTPRIALRTKAFIMLATGVLVLLGLGGTPGSAWGQVGYNLRTPPSVSCSGGLVVPKFHAIPLSLTIPADTGMSHCDSLLNRGSLTLNDGYCHNAYDTLRLFMEQCPFYVGGRYNSGTDAVGIFCNVTGAVSCWSAGGQVRWSGYLEWLKSVLYRNPDTAWYCEDIHQMITAVEYDESAKLAIIQYVTSTGKCIGGFWPILYHSASQGKHQQWYDSLYNAFAKKYGTYFWQDSVNEDTLRNPYDSTYGTIDDHGLSILRGPQFASATPSGPMSSTALLDARLLDNPMNGEIAISFEMGRTALVTMELRDILGRIVPIANAKYLLEDPGSHTARLPLPNLPSGTYYLRVSTDTGESKTLKVVKQ